MTTSEILPISHGRQGQILDHLKAGPKTAADLARALHPSWFRTEPESVTARLADTLEVMTAEGRVREVAGGRFEAVPQVADDAPEVLADADNGDSDADPTGGPADNDNTENANVETTVKRPRGRPKKEAEGNGAPAAQAAPKAKQQSLPKDSGEIADHLGAIERVENELAEAKIGYEDRMNIRRMKRAALDVAKSERRRFSVHDGSNLEQIKAAQKAVDKAKKQFDEAQANALEAKNKVASLEEKLSRTIAGEMPLFDDGESNDDGDDTE